VAAEEKNDKGIFFFSANHQDAIGLSGFLGKSAQQM